MKKIELEEQDDGKTVRCRIKEGKEVVTVRYFRKDMVDSIIKKSKIEVFDEMDNTFRDLKSRYTTITEQQILSAFERIKKRHLSIL